MSVAGTLERYRVLSRIATGGMATVSLAEDTLLGRRVALKRLRTGGEVEGRARLRREALIGASVNHPNVVSIYDVLSDDDGDVVIVMEYVDGETLAARLARTGRIPPDDALPLLTGVAAALDAIHGRGIVHRDVKPANVLLGRDGAVKLADLGIASHPDRTRITSHGSVVGSFRYMAPEQLEGARATPAIDVYALGAVAFEMLAGRPARPEETPLAVARAIADRPAPDLLTIRPEMPVRAAETIQRAMAPDPAKRPVSAGGFVQVLAATFEPPPRRVPRPAPVAAAVAGDATRRMARRPDPGRVFDRGGGEPSRRRPVVPALLALAAVALAAVVILGTDGTTSSRTASSHRASTSNRSAAGHAAAARTATSPHSATTTSVTSSTRAQTTAPAAAPASAHAGKPGPPPGHGGKAVPPGDGGAPPGHGGVPPGQAKKAAGDAPSAHAGAAGSPTSPVGAVETFYERAAAHDYPGAWALADPAFRRQLDGYGSFRASQAADRSIVFDSARTVSNSPGATTVAIRTTSIRTTGTQHCGGTVDVVRASGGIWLLHQIDIACA